MEDKLMDKFIHKEIDKEEELVLPNSIDIKLNKAYEIIKNESTTTKKHNTFKIKKIVAAATLIVAIFSTIIVNPALAEDIPGLNQVLSYFKANYWFNDNYMLNADKINITQKDKGIEINLEGVIYDESSLKFIYTLTSEKKLENGVLYRKSSLKVNGKNISADRRNNEQIKISNDSDKIEKYAVITSFDISDLNLEDNVDIDWTINEIDTFDTEYEKGNWKFNFETSKEALKTNSKIVNADYSVEKDGYKFSIDKIIFTPFEVKITGKYDDKLKKDYYDAQNKSEKNPNDKEAKERVNYLKKLNKELELDYDNIMDEKGNALLMMSGEGFDGSYIYLYKPLKNVPQKLIFTPKDYVEFIEEEGPPMHCPDEEQFISLKDIKAPFEYTQGENMSVIINSIENKEGKTKINATINGDFIASRVGNPFEIVPKGIKYPSTPEEKSEFYSLLESIKNPMKPAKFAEEANNTNNTFDYEYSLKADQEYNLVINKIPEGCFQKDKQFSIDIK